jgi:MFS family permease
MAMVEQNRTAVTYRLERWRALGSGILESAGTVFLLLIAVRRFEAGPYSKALIAGGASVGLLLAPWVVSRVKSSGVRSGLAAARIAAVGAVTFTIMALLPFLPVYVLGCVIATTTSAAVIPLLTQIYQENYPDKARGRYFAKTMMIRIGSAAMFSELAGRFLSGHFDRFRWLLLVFAAACAGASYCLSRCPSRPLIRDGSHPFLALRYARSDRLFRQTLIAWMFLGFAMLMISPMRIEYLANPKYGVLWKGELLTASLVALLTGVIPNLARLALNPIWGWLFDHMNFFVLRLTLNVGLVGGILSFFTTGTPEGLIAGAIFFGVANAGADVAWSLWVTKFAPPDRVADYMSVHTFFTGVRGVVAPLVAFNLVSGLQPHVLGWICVGLIAVGSAFLVPEVKFGKRARAASALVEEISD